MNGPSEQSFAVDRSAEVAMNTPKTPWGERWSCLGVSEEADTATAGVTADSAVGIPEMEDDVTTLARVKREPERSRLGLIWLRQVCTPDVGEACRVRRWFEKRQVCSQGLELFLPVLELFLKLFLLVSLRVAVVRGLVVGTPFAASTFLSLLLSPFGTTFLRQLRAVALEVTVSLALVALIRVRRSRRHRCSTPRNRRCQRLPRLLDDVVIGIDGREQFVVESVSQFIAFILDELVLRREGMKKQVRVGFVGNLLPHVLQTEPKVVHGGDEVSGICTCFHFLAVGLLPQHTPSFLGVAGEAVFQSLPCRRPIAYGTGSAVLVSLPGNMR